MIRQSSLCFGRSEEIPHYRRPKRKKEDSYPQESVAALQEMAAADKHNLKIHPQDKHDGKIKGKGPGPVAVCINIEPLRPCPFGLAPQDDADEERKNAQQEQQDQSWCEIIFKRSVFQHAKRHVEQLAPWTDYQRRTAEYRAESLK